MTGLQTAYGEFDREADEACAPPCERTTRRRRATLIRWFMLWGAICAMSAVADEVGPNWPAERRGDSPGNRAAAHDSAVPSRGEPFPGQSRAGDIELFDPSQQASAAVDSAAASERYPESDLVGTESWTWQWFPAGVVYPPYLAGTRQPRLGSVWRHDSRLGWMWDMSLGRQISVLRLGTDDARLPDGLEFGIEGSAFPRLDLERGASLSAVDFRVGAPLTIGFHGLQAKLGVYHYRSQLGHELLVHFPGSTAVDYSRTVFIWGVSYYITDDLRIYEEAAYSFFEGHTNNWETQFGIDYCPACVRWRGAPFLAVNAHTRPEVDYKRNFVVQAGWHWPVNRNRSLRIGAQYTVGKSDQLQFLNRDEESIGLGVWYDF